MNHYDFYLWTFQLYGIIRHKTSMDRYLEYAIYTADTDKVTNYLSSERTDKARRTETEKEAAEETKEEGSRCWICEETECLCPEVVRSYVCRRRRTKRK